MNDLYNERLIDYAGMTDDEVCESKLDAMKARERDDAERIAFRQHLQDMQGLDNYARLAAYKRKRAAQFINEAIKHVQRPND